MANARLLNLTVALLLGGMLSVKPIEAAADKPEADARARRFIAEHEDKIRPLERAVSMAWWEANITGKDEDFKTKEDAQNRLDLALSDTKRFAELKGVKEAGVKDPLLARQIEVLYLYYLEKQVDPELLKK